MIATRRHLEQEHGARIEAKARRELCFAWIPLAMSMMGGGGGKKGGGGGGDKSSRAESRGEITAPINIAINQVAKKDLQEQLVKGGALFLGGIVLMMAVARLTRR